jgi:glycosyltransferase involved in cell wall biosynthesis
MQLDVIIPTFNRQDMLKLTLNSLLRAEMPAGMEVQVTIVDNNSQDDTRHVAKAYAPRFAGRLRYVFEGRQGRSSALNAGIAATSGDLVGMIDDDEEIDERWYATIRTAFEDDNLEFIGGPYVPKWGAPLPEWFPQNYRGVVGWVDGGQRIVAFSDNFPGILMGGNAVIKRKLLEKVGLYSTSLGRTDRRLLSCEDEDMYRRLLAVGARGFYRPDLIIYHHIPSERLTKSYFRRWCLWRGVSLGVLSRTRPSNCVHLLGVPRWLYRRGARGAVRTLATAINRKNTPAQKLADELAMIDLVGYFYGRHFYRATN